MGSWFPVSFALEDAEVESSRGITVRARTCSVLFRGGSADPYVLNLIDTPGARP